MIILLTLYLQSHLIKNKFCNSSIGAKSSCDYLIASTIYNQLKGLVAQLNSASDYGSEGCRFESCRGHIYWGQEFILLPSFLYTTMYTTSYLVISFFRHYNQLFYLHTPP
nr:hypothetical protein [uncultured bacterium]